MQLEFGVIIKYMLVVAQLKVVKVTRKYIEKVTLLSNLIYTFSIPCIHTIKELMKQ